MRSSPKVKLRGTVILYFIWTDIQERTAALRKFGMELRRYFPSPNEFATRAYRMGVEGVRSVIHVNSVLYTLAANGFIEITVDRGVSLTEKGMEVVRRLIHEHEQPFGGRRS